MLCGQLSYFSQPDRRNKQKREPNAAADVSSLLPENNPGCSRNRENDESGDAPAAMSSTRTPRARQNQQRRNHRDEKKNVIQIHHIDLSGNQVNTFEVEC